MNTALGFWEDVSFKDAQDLVNLLTSIFGFGDNLT
jgi:hypothetical protein